MEKDDLYMLRERMASNPQAFNDLIEDPQFTQHYHGVLGERNVRLPKEFQAAAETCPHLHNKQFYYMTELPADTLLREDLVDLVVAHFEAAAPLRSYLRKACGPADVYLSLLMNPLRFFPWGLVALLLAFTAPLHAQYPGWQQEMDCTMDITMDVDVHQYSGVMDLTYINHNPDVLERIPFHLFFNAFQPGSMMDVRSRNIADPDPRVGDRIVQLPEEEWGWIRVREARVGKTDATFTTDGTIGWLDLPKALAPGKKVRLHLEWDAQVPRQIRRSGWMNKQGVEYSMTQWYRGRTEYDHHGWHTNPYIGREFHGVWGDYDVTIHMPAAYMIGGTGVLQNPEDCGHGYSDSATPTEGMIDWHFVAEDVIDFAWAADPTSCKTLQMEDGPLLHFIHQADTSYGAWDELPAIAARAMQFYSDHVGTYPWPNTVIEGGDGGMEYPMCTLVRGSTNLRSLVGVTAHEMATPGSRPARHQRKPPRVDGRGVHVVDRIGVPCRKVATNPATSPTTGRMADTSIWSAMAARNCRPMPTIT